MPRGVGMTHNQSFQRQYFAAPEFKLERVLSATAPRDIQLRTIRIEGPASDATSPPLASTTTGKHAGVEQTDHNDSGKAWSPCTNWFA